MSLSIRQSPLRLKKPPLIRPTARRRDLKWFWRESFQSTRKRVNTAELPASGRPRPRAE
jgi:hypothetical protein